MSKWSYTEEELQEYFDNPEARRAAGDDRSDTAADRFMASLQQRLGSAKKARAAVAILAIAGVLLLGTLVVGIYFLTLSDDLPSLQQLENPSFQLATVAYTADGEELARYALQNRSWASYEEISPHVVNALIATEDRRFYDHWGVDLYGIMAAVGDAVTEFDLRGASTVTQQLARNLYNEEIGREVTVGRKLKEMVTAVELERRYTKKEVLEMYLNTVEYVYNAFGIEAAARTYFGQSADSLGVLESATLVGMLQNPSLYNPFQRPELTQRRRNVVLQQMVKAGFLDPAFYEEHKDDPLGAELQRSEITSSFAPYFAERVRNWLREWSKDSGVNFYTEGLVVYTTLDSELQEHARDAVTEQMEGLQAVVDCEWGRASGYSRGQELSDYIGADCDAFDYFWSSKDNLVGSFIRETPHFKNLREQGLSRDEALRQLRGDSAFLDSLKAEKTRLEAGLVSIDPRTGYVKAWVGGRNLEVDWYDHVNTAKRQPGSTFKPFVYTTAIDNGYSPYYRLMDSTFVYRDAAGNVWSPSNSDGTTGQYLTLREGLAMSKNTITGRLMLEVKPENVAFYAHRMGIKSDLEEVPALALGTSDVSLLEMTSAYATLANGGLYYEPTIVTRIEDRRGNVLYEAEPVPQEALSEETAYTVVDMMRGVIDHPQGTGQRVRWQFGLREADLAGKTGTTQNSGEGAGGSDGWFILMNPELVTGAWVGFNDRRITFRSNWWGQGAHNALFLVGDYLRDAVAAGDLALDARFPTPADYGRPDPGLDPDLMDRRRTPRNDRDTDDRVGW